MDERRDFANEGGRADGNEDTAETADQFDLYQEALTETRRVVDVQVQMAEDTDEEILTLMRLELLALGGVVTLFTYSPSLVTAALPWVVTSVLLLLSSILLAAYIYRGITLYAGFGDHGYDRHIPPEKVPYESIIRSSEDRSSRDGTPLVEDVPSVSAFRASLLDEHQAGISHNNVEIKYRSQLHQQTVFLLLFAILTLGIGLGWAILEEASTATVVVVSLTTIGVVIASLHTILKSAGLVARFIQTTADPDRLTYGYGFEREYPYFSRVCAFVTTYLYDPADEEW
ncbi:hypothetical protein ACLI4Z_01475 [Natrialbaceae archaeon A-arb3/5]